jgi:hypothetical protein
MKTSQLLLGIAAAAAALAAGSAIAQQQQQQPAAVVEILACNFNDGQDMGDLLAAANRFNGWADQNGATDYTAIVMTPFLFSNQVTFDTLWLGAWPNATAMGAGEAKWLATGGPVRGAFESTMDCGSHALYAAVAIRTPAGPPPENGGLTMFRDCKIHDGRTAGEAIAALRQWSDYMAERGHSGFDAVLFPLMGESPDADFSFKSVHGFASVEEMGRSIDLYTTGGVQRRNELLGRVIDCDSPRTYLSNRVRAAAQPGR